MSKIKNTSDLRRLLLDIIGDIRDSKIEPRQALAISSLASQILTSARLDLQADKMNGKINPLSLISTQVTKEEPSTYKGLTAKQYEHLLDSKERGRDVDTICNELGIKNKRLIGAAFHNKPYED